MQSEASIKDYISLLKPRVMTLVVFTGAIGLIVAPQQLPFIQAITVILAIALGAGASGAFNMWYDRDIDAVMQRTKERPLPRGVMLAENSLAFSGFIGAAALLLMQVASNTAATLWLLFSMFFYCVIYTIWLKRRTPQNIVIGGAAGAFPPLIGWVAATGSASVEAWALFAIIFFWTPPHFWALSLYRQDDYKAANIPMLPVIKGHIETRKQILIYSLLLFAVCLLPIVFQLSGWIYFIAAVLLNIRFLWLVHEILFNHEDALARKLFFYSITYLFALFTMLAVDKLAYNSFNLPVIF